MPEIVLASTSPRRKALLARAGVGFVAVDPEVEEFEPGMLEPVQLCSANAEYKARSVAMRHPEAIVLGADTIVVLDGEVFGKPRHFAHAREMLGRLSGRIHEVLTAVFLIRQTENKICHFLERTRVKFRELGSFDMEAYLEKIQPLDKAGAYAAQEDEGNVIESVEGSFTNVVGLPLERVLEAIGRFDSR